MSEELAAHAQAYAYCAYCPKLCRFSCPVSEATRTETVSPWGKMSAARLVERGSRRMEEEASRAVHACLGCGRCTTFCKHESPVEAALFAARAAAIEAGVQPRGAASTLATFHQAQNPFGCQLGELVATWRTEAPVRLQLFTGCTALVKAPQLIADTLAVSRAFGAPMGVSKASGRCCGYPLYAAGALEQLRDHAHAVARALEGWHELVVLDPGCAFTLKVLYPQLAVRLRCRVRTVVEVLAENLPHVGERPPAWERVAYHDACKLGRGLGQYDEPRRLVAHAARDVLEGSSTRAEAGCSGGGGLLPRTMPELAAEVARRQADDLAFDREVPVVTACPTSKRMFERAGRNAIDLVSLLRQWVEER